MKDRPVLMLAAERFDTPVYVYDRAVIEERCKNLLTAFPTSKIHYAVKANSNPEILKIIERQGLNAEAVSVGELEIARSAGFSRARISFTCSNLTEKELRHAARVAGRVHLDSLVQLETWGRLKLGKEVSLRLNQGIGAGHHSHVITGGPDSKFGIGLSELKEVKKITRRYGLTITGLEQHIGSNILETKMLLKAMGTLFTTAKSFPTVTHLDFGGGFGVPYRPTETRLDLKKVGTGFAKLREAFIASTDREVECSFEPGRYLVAEAGTLVVEVVDRKSTSAHSFIGVNSGFNHLIRPAMYDAYHEIENISRTRGKKETVTVAGNVCESGDIFGKRRIMIAPKIGDLLAIRTAGAYGFSMASNYNLRRMPKEILVSKGVLKDISFNTREYAR